MWILLTEEKLSELKVIFLEEEIKELKHALREARNRHAYIQQLLEQSEDARRRQLVLIFPDILRH